jgi:hypothetical protein
MMNNEESCHKREAFVYHFRYPGGGLGASAFVVLDE